MKLFSKTRTITTCALMAALALTAMPASALNVRDMIQISPVDQKITLEPGESFRSTFKVHNIGNNDFEYLVYSTPYNITDRDYTPNFDDVSTYSQMSDWIIFDWDSGKLAIDETVEIPFTINVPKDVPAGGQYAAIMAQVKKDDEEQAEGTVGVKSVARAALLLYASIPGNTREEGSIVENNIPAFLFTSPLTVSSLVKNDGNVHADATYSLQIFPLFSSEEVYTTEETPEAHVILPGTSRYTTISWEGAPQLGIFRVVQTIKFLDKTSTNSRIVFICPMWFLILVLALIFFCIFWVFSRSRARKRAA